MLEPEITAYYRLGAEPDRLSAGEGKLEWLRTRDVLRRVLPPPPARILDIGGASGVYAGPLAADGYSVHLVDPMPEHVAAAATLPGVTAAVGDARSLAEPDAGADAVLLLGPLYHLTDRADRLRAWREAARVARPGAPIVGATINRYATLLDGFNKGHLEDPRFRPMVEGALADGVHRNDTEKAGWFTTAYLHHPDELAAEVADAGLRYERTVMVEGPAWLFGRRLGDLMADPDRTGLLLDMMRRVEGEASMFGAGSHLLTVARA